MLKEFHCISEQIQLIVINRIPYISLKNAKSFTTSSGHSDEGVERFKNFNSNELKLFLPRKVGIYAYTCSTGDKFRPD